MSRQRVAAAVGVPLSRVSARLDLLQLPAGVQGMVRAGDVTLSHAGDLARQVKARRRGAIQTTTPRCPPHFTQAHPLAAQARLVCDLAGHPTTGRLGHPARYTACGACWEQTIRDDCHHQTTPLPALDDDYDAGSPDHATWDPHRYDDTAGDDSGLEGGG